MIGCRLAENRHPCDITVVSFVASTEVGDHTVAFLIRSIVVARRRIQHQKTRMTRMRSLLDHRDEQSVGNFATGHTGSELRKTAIVGLDRDFTGLAHELDLLRAFVFLHFGERAPTALHFRYTPLLRSAGSRGARELRPV